MNESEYNQRVDQLMFAIEEHIEASGVDVDFERSGGLLTLTVELNASQIILSRQPAMREVWLADLSGGFHFVCVEGTWASTQGGEVLADRLSYALLQQAGEAVTFDI